MKSVSKTLNHSNHSSSLKFSLHILSLPTSVKRIILKMTPWYVLLRALLAIASSLSTVAIYPKIKYLGTVLPELMTTDPLFFGLTAILNFIGGILLLASFGAVRKQLYRGWVFLLIAQVLSTVQAGLSLLFGFSGGILLPLVVGYYLLWQLKSEFNSQKSDQVTE